jgi:hypothetical protein
MRYKSQADLHTLFPVDIISIHNAITSNNPFLYSANTSLNKRLEIYIKNSHSNFQHRYQHRDIDPLITSIKNTSVTLDFIEDTLALSSICQTLVSDIYSDQLFIPNWASLNPKSDPRHEESFADFLLTVIENFLDHHALSPTIKNRNSYFDTLTRTINGPFMKDKTLFDRTILLPILNAAL